MKEDFPALQTPAAALAESTLLIVDDLPENLSVLGELLSGAHYRVRAANSGMSALRLAAQASGARSDPARHDDARHGRLRGAASGCGPTRRRATSR